MDDESDPAESNSPAEPLRVDISSEIETCSTETDLLSRAIRMTASEYSADRGTISVAIVNDEQMHELNRRYLNHDYTTDVLSFAYDQGEDWIEGELVICKDFAKRSAIAFGWTPESELALYAIHGTLHLMGLDDHSDTDRRQMRLAERELLTQLGIDGAQRHGYDDLEGADVQ